MDCQMPDLDGFAATVAIRERETAGQHIPIIAMTAAAMEGDRELCIEAGMDDYITKPVRADAIEEALGRWLVDDRPADTHDEPAHADDAHDVHGDRDDDVHDDGAPVLDPSRISTLRDLDSGDGELLRLLVDEYANDARAQLDTLHAALAEGDPHAVERAAHTVKGASANIGATRLAELCRELEALGRAAALGSGREMLERIEAEFDNVRHALGVELTRS
jgi:HPt (histidine-containing phosphotransfer) domain-containing protein